MKKGLLFLLAALLLLGTGCAQGRAGEESPYVLYFLSADGYGSALATEAYNWTAEEPPEPETLLQVLLKGPSTEGLASPFPRGVSYQWCRWDEGKPGNLRVSLSEQYGSLSDISLTLADYCIVLTLSQLEGVESVEILSDGRATGYRSHQVLTAQEAVLAERAVA